MKTQAEAEALAIETIDNYLGLCGCDTLHDQSNALMKLCSVASVKMAKATGPEDAYNRILGTAFFIQKLSKRNFDINFAPLERVMKFPYLLGTSGTSMSRESAESLQRNNNAVVSKELRALGVLCIEMSREVIDASPSLMFLEMAYTNLIGISANHTFVRKYDRIAIYPAKYNVGRVIEGEVFEPSIKFTSPVDLKNWIEEQKQAGTF